MTGRYTGRQVWTVVSSPSDRPTRSRRASRYPKCLVEGRVPCPTLRPPHSSGPTPLTKTSLLLSLRLGSARGPPWGSGNTLVEGETSLPLLVPTSEYSDNTGTPEPSPQRVPVGNSAHGRREDGLGDPDVVHLDLYARTRGHCHGNERGPWSAPPLRYGR